MGVNEGKILRGEAALLYAERTGQRVRVSDVTGFRPETVRAMLAVATPQEREDLADDIVVEVVLPTEDAP